MSVICKFCNHIMPNKENVFGTICVNCGKYIEPLEKPKFIQEADDRQFRVHNILRSYLKKYILGDKDGN